MATLDTRPGLVKLRIHRGNAFSLRCRFPNGYSAGKTFSATLDGAAIAVSVDASDPDFDDIIVTATGSQTANLDRLVEWKLTDTTSGSQDILVGPVEVTDGGTGSSSSSVNVTTDQVTVEVTTPALAGGAGVTDGDKGDITVSNSGATWTINAGAVDASKVAADVATQADLDALTAADVGADPAGTAFTAVSTHSADTTDVHGIADTSALETTTGAQAKVDAHAADTTSVHGIADTSALETTSGAQAKVDAHAADTTNVHGIADTSALLDAADIDDDGTFAAPSATTVPSTRATKVYVDDQIIALPSLEDGDGTTVNDDTPGVLAIDLTSDVVRALPVVFSGFSHANSDSETSRLSSPIVIPANTLALGSSLWLSLHFSHTQNVLGGATVVRIKLNGSTVWSVTLDPDQNATPRTARVVAEATLIDLIGTRLSGVMLATESDPAGGDDVLIRTRQPAVAPIIDPTVDNEIDITVQHSTSSASLSIALSAASLRVATP